MNCRFKDECPSYNSLCENQEQDLSTCVKILITAYENAREELKGYKDIGLTPEQLQKVDREYAALAKEVTTLRKEARLCGKES